MKQKFTSALSLALIAAMLLTSVALADSVVNNIDTTIDSNLESRTITSGGTTSVGFFVAVTNGTPVGDPTGCNATGADPATVNLSVPAGVSASSDSLVFTGCGITQSVTFSSSTVGSYAIGVSSVTGGKPGSLWATAPASFTLVVNPPANTAPSLNLAANITAEATSAAGAAVSYIVSATDAEDNPDPVPSCSPASGSTFPLGPTTVNCSVTDSGGMSASGSFTVTVQDTTAPSLNLPATITAEATSSAGAAVSYTATASDLVDGSVAINCSPASGSTFGLGTTPVSCSATDSHTNSASGGFNVVVTDTTAPVLALPANITAEATGATGAAVSYSASASDLVDGAITPACSPISGSTFPIAATTVNCSATDAHSNTASGSFSVTVVDTTPPSLTLPANITAEATGSSGASVTYSASASDLVDGAITPNCSPASGSTFALGTTTVNCSATDAHSNSASGSFSVTVVDTTPPALTLPANITAEATGPTGATMTYTATANDLVDGSVVVSCVPASGSTFALGTTAVNCSATDAHSNTATGSFTVTVQDTTAPALSLPSAINAFATGNSSAIVTYSASATDLVDGSVSVTCTPASGSSFPVGQTTVNCSATDAHSNTATGSFNITVSYNFLGFFQPIDNLPGLNRVKAGSAIPVKFSLSGNQGLNIFSANSPSSGNVTCGTTAPVDDIETTVTAGSSSLSYDAVANQYVFVWKTDKAWAGTCRTLTVKLIDGTIKQANFQFTK